MLALLLLHPHASALFAAEIAAEDSRFSGSNQHGTDPGCRVYRTCKCLN